MICKIATISHSSEALDYCEQGGELIHANGVSGNSKEINKQFKQVHALKPNIKHKSLHAIISFNPEDRKLNKGELMDISEKYAKKHNFDKNQYAVYLHEDKSHLHLHIVGNRIGTDRKVHKSSHSYAKNTEFSMETEKEYSLIKANRKEKGKNFIPNKSISKSLKSIIDQRLKNSKSIEELSEKLKKDGVLLQKGRGVSFLYKENDKKPIKIKGSEIGKGYSLKGLENQINLSKMKFSDKFTSMANRFLEEDKKPKIKETKAKEIEKPFDYDFGLDDEKDLKKGHNKGMGM